MWQACDQGDYEKAESLSRQFVLYIRFMREARKSIQLTKKIMRDLGLPGGFERPPLLPLTTAEEGMASKVKQQMGLGG